MFVRILGSDACESDAARRPRPPARMGRAGVAGMSSPRLQGTASCRRRSFDRARDLVDDEPSAELSYRRTMWPKNKLAPTFGQASTRSPRPFSYIQSRLACSKKQAANGNVLGSQTIAVFLHRDGYRCVKPTLKCVRNLTLASHPRDHERFGSRRVLRGGDFLRRSSHDMSRVASQRFDSSVCGSCLRTRASVAGVEVIRTVPVVRPLLEARRY